MGRACAFSDGKGGGGAAEAADRCRKVNTRRDAFRLAEKMQADGHAVSMLTGGQKSLSQFVE